MKKLIFTFAAMLASTPVFAGSFDFTTLGGNNTQLGHSETSGDVTARAYDNGEISPVDDLLWLRDRTNDHGLGVCDSGSEDCVGDGGDVNELDNIDSKEGISLENNKWASGSVWTSLWVSSLDGNANADASPENGTICWGSTEFSCGLNSFSFAYGDAFLNGGVEGDLFDSAAFLAVFDATARFVLFVAGDCSLADGCDDYGNNDYLVWKGAVSDVPAPGVIALLGLGFLGMGMARRRKA